MDPKGTSLLRKHNRGSVTSRDFAHFSGTATLLSLADHINAAAFTSYSAQAVCSLAPS